MYFPIFADITESRFLVVGSGRVARRKLGTLLKYTDLVTVVTEDENYAMDEIEVRNKSYDKSDLKGMTYVIAATDSPEINSCIARDCKEQGILCDVSVSYEEGSFLFPGVVKRGDLTVAVTTDGRSPAMARYVREEIDEMLPEYLDKVLDKAEESREKVKAATQDRDARKMLNRKIIELLVHSRGEASTAEIDRIIEDI